MPDFAANTAIIGAGLAGLGAAARLGRSGLSVDLLEAKAGPGGRLATLEITETGRRFDHGGQFVTVRDPALRMVMAGLLDRGRAARWNAHIVRLEADGSTQPHPVERFVGMPSMAGLAGGLAAALPLTVRPHYETRVSAIGGEAGAWMLRLTDGAVAGPYNRLVLAMPPHAAASLLRDRLPDLASRVGTVTMAPCWALLLTLPEGRKPGWDAAFIAGAGGEDRPFSWIAHDGSKPGRTPGGWVAHTAADWSARHRQDDPALVMERLRVAFTALTGMEAPATAARLHFWPEALPLAPLETGFIWDAPNGVGLCGDWCLATRAEAAFISGHRLAGAMGAA